MEQMIPVLNRLQDALISTKISSPIDLPQIAVVGSQSVGKSSVLEALVGRDFLPRGTGVVTRRPLILQLRNVRREGKEKKEWAEFAHIPGRMFEDFNAVRREIEEDTNRVCGQNKAICHEAILLKVYSPYVADLTLVDLPGITKVPIGDQPADIGDRIHELIMEYIEKPNCMILAVTAINTDLANSDALKLARAADPEGLRTVGVLTKIDLMDPGTDCVDILSGQVYPLKHGYIAIVNRSQRDNDRKKQVKDALKSEAEFFMNHPMYRRLNGRWGVQYLSKHLSHLLMQHVRECLPELKARIFQLIQDTETELQSYGEVLTNDATNSHSTFLLQVFSRFARNFADALEGRLHSSPNSILEAKYSEQLNGGARIHYIFHDLFTKAVMTFDPFTGLSDAEIRATIRNATGPRSSLFVPETAFELLVKKQIIKLEAPALQCLEHVYEELQRLLLQCELPAMSRFLVLRERIFDVVHSILKRCVEPAQQMISNLINIELAYINTSHPDFIGGSQAVSLAIRKQGHDKNQTEEKAVEGDFIHPVEDPVESGGIFSFFRNTAARSHQAQTSTEKKENESERKKKFDSSQKYGGILLPQVPTNIEPPKSTNREELEVDIIKFLIASYFQIVRKNVTDAVPKSIMYFMVNTAKDVLQRELVAKLYRDELFPQLLEEASDINEKRLKCQRSRAFLHEALDIVSQVRDCPLHRDIPALKITADKSQRERKKFLRS